MPEQVPDRINYDRVLEIAKRIVGGNPANMNPQDARGNSVYIKLPGFDDTINIANRCLGGEILYQLDAVLPEEGLTVTQTPDWDRFTSKAMQFLLEIQRMADYINPATGKPRPWGEALELAISSFSDADSQLNFSDE